MVRSETREMRVMHAPLLAVSVNAVERVINALRRGKGHAQNLALHRAPIRRQPVSGLPYDVV
jgi:hypothetical protein